MSKCIATTKIKHCLTVLSMSIVHVQKSIRTGQIYSAVFLSVNIPHVFYLHSNERDFIFKSVLLFIYVMFYFNQCSFSPYPIWFHCFWSETLSIDFHIRFFVWLSFNFSRHQIYFATVSWFFWAHLLICLFQNLKARKRNQNQERSALFRHHQYEYLWIGMKLEINSNRNLQIYAL